MGPGGFGGISSRTVIAPLSSFTFAHRELALLHRSRRLGGRRRGACGGAGAAAQRGAASPSRTSGGVRIIRGRLEHRRGPAPARLGAALLIAAMGLAAGCASGPVLERAIRARGGPLRSFVRTSDAEVEAGFPGTWQWRMTYLAPDRYAWSITTTAGVDHYLFDGTMVRAFVGGRELGADTSPRAPLRTQAAFIAVTNLDAARAGGTATALPPGELPPGVAAGLSVTMPENGASYRLGFDGRFLLVWATGPFEVP